MKLIGCRPGSVHYEMHAVFRNEAVPEGHGHAYLAMGFGSGVAKPWWTFVGRVIEKPHESFYYGNYVNYTWKHADVSDAGDFESFEEFFKALADPEEFAVQHVL